VQMDVRMRADPPARYRGHAAIELKDKTRILLYPIWHKDAIRPKKEIAQFEGKQVEVTGKLAARAPDEDPMQPAANLILPCLTSLAELKLTS
jgi:hypothetical protein